MSILKDLFYGNINILEQKIRIDEEYKSILESIENEFDYLKKY